MFASRRCSISTLRVCSRASSSRKLRRALSWSPMKASTASPRNRASTVNMIATPSSLMPLSPLPSPPEGSEAGPDPSRFEWCPCPSPCLARPPARLAGRPGRILRSASWLDDAAVVADFQLGRLAGRGELVLGHQHPQAAADHPPAFLEGLEATQVQPDRGVVPERPASGGVGRGARGTGPLTQLVGRDDRGATAGDGAA